MIDLEFVSLDWSIESSIKAIQNGKALIEEAIE